MSGASHSSPIGSRKRARAGGKAVRSARVSISSTRRAALQVDEHRVADEDRVLGAPRLGRLAEDGVLERPRAERLEARVDARDVGVENGAVGRRKGSDDRARSVAEAVRPQRPVRLDRLAAEVAPRARPRRRRRSRSIWKNRSCAWTKPSARAAASCRFAAVMRTTPSESRATVAGALSPASGASPLSVGRLARTNSHAASATATISTARATSAMRSAFTRSSGASERAVNGLSVVSVPSGISNTRAPAELERARNTALERFSLNTRRTARVPRRAAHADRAEAEVKSPVLHRMGGA